MRNGFESFVDGNDVNIKDVGEFIHNFVEQMEGQVILENNIESLLNSIKRTIDREPDSDYLGDYPELQ